MSEITAEKSPTLQTLSEQGFGYLPPLMGRSDDVVLALKLRQCAIDALVEHGEEIAARLGDSRVAQMLATIEHERLAGVWVTSALTDVIALEAGGAKR